MSTKNHFETLEVKPGASLDDIKKSYRTLAKKWHPDKNNESGAEEKFKEISAAYDYLKSDDRREILERDLKKPKQTPTTTTTQSSPNSYYQGETRTTNNAGTGTSYKFGENYSNRYSKSTFGSAGESYSSSKQNTYNKTGKKKSKRKTGETNKTPSSGWKPWSSDWNMDDDDLYYDNPTSTTATPPPNFSFAFKSFVDDLGVNFDAFFTDPSQGSWDFSSFYDDSDPFSNFFHRPGSASAFSSPTGGRPPRRPRPRHVAPEDEDVGLDEEYFFSPPTRSRSQTSFSSKSFFTDEDTSNYRQDTTNDFDEDFDSSLFKCTYCGKRMPFNKLSSHEPGCSLRKAGKFKESDNDDDDVGGWSGEEDQYPQQTGDWRQAHQDLLHNIRRAKKVAKHTHARMSAHTSHTSRAADIPSPSPTKDDGVAQVRCKYCERKFSHPAAKHHIPFCEKWTREHGTPLNPANPAGSRDTGSKSHRAKEYAKHIPKPGMGGGGCAEEDANSPRSPRTHFPDIGATKRETMHRPGAPSGTGLHASTSYAPRGRTSTQTSKTTGIGKTPRTKMGGYSDSAGFSPTSPVDDSYGFGVSGAKLKGEARSSRLGDRCSICKKGRLSCTCGVRRTGS